MNLYQMLFLPQITKYVNQLDLVGLKFSKLYSILKALFMITCAVCGYLHVYDSDSSLCAVEIVLFCPEIRLWC